MDREKAWEHYFATGDRTPLVEAYVDSIRYIAWARYRNQQEDMTQVGLIGLLKAIEKIDPKRVKSKDAWVWLNVKSMMWNVTQPKKTVAIYEQLFDDDSYKEFEEILCQEFDYDLHIDLKDALKLDEDSRQAYLSNYKPLAINTQNAVARYHAGTLPLKVLGRELGISRRQAHKLVGKEVPDSWKWKKKD